jgi:aminoglycoside phosphotransferase (APT) family kinase protein
MQLARTTDPDGALGLDVSKVGRWMLALPLAPEPPLTFALNGQGKSNITVVVTDAAGRRWVLRRPPLGELLPTAHDVVREYRILAALSGTQVPAPRPVAMTVDAAVTEAPLVVMEHVDGLVLDEMAHVSATSEDLRRSIGYGLIDALATVHAVDLQTAGLEGLASHRPLAPRQLKRWRKQWEVSRTHDEPRIDAIADRLESAMPGAEELVLVHGDYHLRNAILDATSGEVQAIVDWELSTLGEPLADLGLLLAYWPQEGDPPGQPFPASTLPGFPRRDELVSAYGRVTGRDTSAVGFWEVLGLWKVGIILEGIRRRALDDPRNAARGATASQAVIDAVITRAWTRAAELGI